MSVVHLAILLISLLGFAALAVAMERHAELLLRQVPAPPWRWAARALGWALLAAALALGLWQLGVGVGITLWLGWLSIAALLLVFGLPKWPWQPPARPSRARKARSEAASRKQAAVMQALIEQARQGRRPGRWIAAGLLAATLSMFVTLLLRVDTRPLLSDGALRGVAGPWRFTLAESDRRPPRVVHMDVPIKAFDLRFCDTCDADIRAAYLKVNRPRSMRAAGMVFEAEGQERHVDIQLPANLTADSELWLTVVGRDGQVHQQAWRMDRVSPAAVAWFEQQRRAHGPP